jgi:hypothetical protein
MDRIPYAKHGAERFTNICHRNHQVMYVNIPAPWFAYGDINWDIYITVMAQLIVIVYGVYKVYDHL